MPELLKIELGGGGRPRGDGFVNVDKVGGPGVDVVCDFETQPLPYGPRTVGAVYSSHCLEHLAEPVQLLREVARVCAVGAEVELRVPHPYSEMASCPGHRCVIGEDQMRQWTVSFTKETWLGGPRRLRLLGRTLVPSAWFAEAKRLFPHLTDDLVMRFVPNTCHEVRFRLQVVNNECAAPSSTTS